MVKLFPVL